MTRTLNTSRDSFQKVFDAISYGFEWTEDGWYRFDRKAAMSAALKARNAEAKRLRAEGWTVRVFTLKDQLRTMGGIGSGHPEISEMVNAYGFNASR